MAGCCCSVRHCGSCCTLPSHHHYRPMEQTGCSSLRSCRRSSGSWWGTCTPCWPPLYSRRTSGPSDHLPRSVSTVQTLIGTNTSSTYLANFAASLHWLVFIRLISNQCSGLALCLCFLQKKKFLISLKIKVSTLFLVQKTW